MHTAGLLLRNRTSKSLFSGFVDDEDVETQFIRYSFCLNPSQKNQLQTTEGHMKQKRKEQNFRGCRCSCRVIR